MIYIYYILMAIVMGLFMLFASTFGFILAALLGIASLFVPRVKPDNTDYSTPDHHIHVPIQTVPVEFYTLYTIYLKSQEWRALRKVVLKRDNYKCVDCNIKGISKWNPNGPKLQVHHLHYDGIETMTFTPDQLVSVCPACHDIRHGRH